MHIVADYINRYGYFVLFLGLMLEMLALPLPGEAIMSYAGLFVFQGKMNWLLSIVLAAAGSSLGVTLSYGIGYRLGMPFFEKYGRRVHLGPERLRKTSEWFARYGNKLLIFAYFIPGIRHMTGYFSGVTRIPFRTYMLYAYSGALIWTGIFITLGKILGPKWEVFHRVIGKYLLIAGILAALVFLAMYTYKTKKTQIFSFAERALGRGAALFHSFGRMRLFIVFMFAVFIALSALTIGLIQDFIASEFAEFDEVAAFIVHVVFAPGWDAALNFFARLASVQVYTALAVLTAARILAAGKDRRLEAGFLAFVLLGAELWEEGLRRFFHRFGPLDTPDTFPSEPALVTLAVFGFCAYLSLRHRTAVWLRYAAAAVTVAAALLTGLSRIYFDAEYPSDVAAGLVFGGVWVSLNVILLELFRILRTGKVEARCKRE
ncbi:VTT domain-containing protein [Paenibacillus sp. P26]|nr:VTT domain-containing protein [Paenibacillus sp. P26]